MMSKREMRENGYRAKLGLEKLGIWKKTKEKVEAEQPIHDHADKISLVLIPEPLGFHSWWSCCGNYSL